MKNIIKLLFILSVLIGFTTSCEKDKPVLTYEGADFIFFDVASGSVKESDNSVNYILVKLAASELSSTVTVDFEITSDDAVEGTNFEVLNTSKTLTFKAGAYVDTIKIKSIDNTDEDGSKLINIKLKNGGDYNLGYVGPDHNNSTFEFAIIDDDCAFVADYFSGAPTGVEFYPNSEYLTEVTFSKVSEVGAITTYEVDGIMKSIYAGWSEVVDADLPSGNNKVKFVFDNTDPSNPTISITGDAPSTVAGLDANLSTTDAGAWIYDINLDDSKMSTFSTCEKTAEIYYTITVTEGADGTVYDPNFCYLKLNFNED